VSLDHKNVSTNARLTCRDFSTSLDEKTGLTDRVEVYNIPKFGLDYPHVHPEPVAKNIAEVEQFARVSCARGVLTVFHDPRNLYAALDVGSSHSHFRSPV
jgi:hypothetical protein